MTLIADPAANDSTALRGWHVVRKLHGCAAHYRAEAAVRPRSRAEERIIVRRSQLTHWRSDRWARDFLRQAAREHVLLLIGFSAQDPIIVGELTQLLEDVHRSTAPTGVPRVVAINNEPDTALLRQLIQAGLGGAAPAADVVTQIATASATTTAALLVLLTEILARGLESELTAAGVSLPSDLDARMAALTVAAPAMLRWSYLLRPPRDGDFIQQANLAAAAERGYVPLLSDRETTAGALRGRVALRAALGLVAPESTRDALADHSFIVATGRGTAYLPTGLPFDALRGACRPGGELERARDTLGWPTHVECILVADDPAGPRGIGLETGLEVPVT